MGRKDGGTEETGEEYAVKTLATFVLMMFGCAVIAQTKLTLGTKGLFSECKVPLVLWLNPLLVLLTFDLGPLAVVFPFSPPALLIGGSQPLSSSVSKSRMVANLGEMVPFTTELFGCGSVAQVTTSENSNGHYLSINLGFALGTTFGVYVSRGVSGAHLNPAVSLSLCFLGRHPWTRLPFYVLFQILGAFMAAATVALQYYDAIQFYSGGHLTVSGPKATAGIFSTYPADYLSLWGGIMDQVVGTAALMVCILALGDSRNSPAPAGLQPVLVGAVVLVIGVSMGSNSGYALNPARDIGPRLFTYIAGWGDEVFKAGRGWWWVPLVATCAGALVGTLIYELLIEVHHPEKGLISESSAQGQATESRQAVELHPEKKDPKDGLDGTIM